MIEMHGVGEPPLITDPFEDSLDYTQRIAIAQNEELTRLLESLDANIYRLSNFMPRQLAREAPQCVDLGPLSGKPGAGTAAGAVYQTTQKFRVTFVILGGASGDNIRLKVGSNPYNFFSNGALVAIPFEIQMDRGMDISVADITTPAAVAWTFMFFGYPE